MTRITASGRGISNFGRVFLANIYKSKFIRAQDIFSSSLRKGIVSFRVYDLSTLLKLGQHL